jgi:hypothetical protein
MIEGSNPATGYGRKKYGKELVTAMRKKFCKIWSEISIQNLSKLKLLPLSEPRHEKLQEKRKKKTFSKVWTFHSTYHTIHSH